MFEVLTPGGVRHTRNGAFVRDREGRLATRHGHLVLARGEGPPEERAIVLPPGRPVVDRQGGVLSGGRPAARLSVAAFRDPHRLVRQGRGLFANPDPANLAGQSPAAVLQGFLEGSNVDALGEMSALIKAHRQFEGVQRVVKAYDEMARKAYNELPRF